jgi:predicted membrane protein
VLVSTVVGRAPGLAVLGLVLLPFVVVANAFDFPLHQGIGEASATITDQAELEGEYLHGIGQYTVDLTELTITDDEAVDIGLSIGRLDVLVPADQSVVVDAHVGAGEIILPDDTTDGIDVDASWARTRPDEPILELDVEVGLGQINVVEVER